MKPKNNKKAHPVPCRKRRKGNRPEYTSERGIAKRWKEGRGAGDGPSYIPWFRVPEFSSRGYRTMTMSAKFGRVIHLFSVLEWMIFLMLEALGEIVSLKEQVPLDRDETRAIAKTLRIKHPQVYGIDVVVTTDFLIELQDTSGATRKRAIAVKYWKDLSDRRVIEKLQIEQAYHAARGTEYVIMTERDVPRELAKSLTIVRAMLRPGSMSDIPTKTLAAADTFMRPLLGEVSWGQMVVSCDTQLGLKPGTAARIARYLIATRAWTVDLTQPLMTRMPAA